MIAVELPWFPLRRLGRRHLTQGIRLAEKFNADRSVDDRQSCLVSEELANRDRAFTVLAEFRPMPSNKIVEFEQGATVGDGHRDRGHPLGRREHRYERVAPPWQGSRRITESAPEVDHRATIAIHRARGTDFVPIDKVGAEGVCDRPETFINVAADNGVGPIASHPRVSLGSPAPGNGLLRSEI